MLSVSIDDGEIRLDELPRPQLEQPTDAIVMVTTAAIGHWEIEAARGPGSSTTPGAQFAGIVVEAGEAISRVNIDDLVVAISAANMDGRFVRFGEDSLAGGHAEYVRIPNADEVLVKTTAASEERSVFAGGEGALGIAAANEALDIAGEGPIVVMGCDTSGLTAIAWIRHRRGRKSSVFAVENNPARLSAAKSLGATELVFDEFNSAEATAVIAGMSVRSTPPNVPVFLTTPASPTGDDEPGRKWPTFEDARRAEMAIRLRQIDLTPLVSTVLPLDEAAEAYRVAIEQPPGVRSVLLKP